jgi:transcriptional regulator with XRE-family HTH domain
MPSRSLESLGALVREKRGAKKLREAATEIGVSAATLLRVEGGKTPDVATFGKICKWLQLDPGSFLGFEATNAAQGLGIASAPHTQVSAHLRMDATSQLPTLQALAQMIILASNQQFEEDR